MKETSQRVRPQSDSEDDEADEAWPPPLMAWYTVMVLLLANVFSFVDRMIMNLLIGPIRRDLNISDTEVSLLIGFAFALFFTVMGLPLGRLADRVERRRMIAIGISTWSVMTAACGFANQFLTLFLARIGVGTGEATLAPAAYSMISDCFPPDRLGRALAVFSFGAPIGSGLALMIGGGVVNLVADLPQITLPMIGEIRPWQLSFIFVGVPGLLVAMLMFTLREPKRRGRLSSSSSVPMRNVVLFIWIRRSIFGAHFFAVAMLAIILYGAVAWVPQFFVRTYGMNVGDVGLVYGAIYVVSGTAGLMFGGILSDRLFARGYDDAHFRTILITIVCMLPFWVVMPLMPKAYLAFIVLAPAVFASSMFGGSAIAALQLVTPNELRGQISALYYLIITLVGLGFGPTIYALVTDFVFGDDGHLRYSLILVTVTVLPIAAVVLNAGRRAYGAAIAVQKEVVPKIRTIS